MTIIDHETGELSFRMYVFYLVRTSRSPQRSHNSWWWTVCVLV